MTAVAEQPLPDAMKFAYVMVGLGDIERSGMFSIGATTFATDGSEVLIEVGGNALVFPTLSDALAWVTGYTNLLEH